MLGAAILSIPTLAHAFHTPAAPHGRALSFIYAGVLIVHFAVTLPSLLTGKEDQEGEPPRWSLRLTVAVLSTAGLGAAFTSDWFVSALTPATHAMHMSQDFAGLVVVAIAGNAVENVVGVQLAARNRLAGVRRGARLLLDGVVADDDPLALDSQHRLPRHDGVLFV